MRTINIGDATGRCVLFQRDGGAVSLRAAQDAWRAGDDTAPIPFCSLFLFSLRNSSHPRSGVRRTLVSGKKRRARGHSFFLQFFHSFQRLTRNAGGQR